MIVITSLDTTERKLMPGDLFKLNIRDATGHHVAICEEITEYKTINYIASYRFALEDGTCTGFHLCGIFANKDALPVEIIQAVRLEDLTTEQRENFNRTSGIGGGK